MTAPRHTSSSPSERGYEKEIYLPHTLAASPVARCSTKLVRSPAVHAPGVALGPFVPRAAPAPCKVAAIGQPSAPVGLRMRAYGSPPCGLPSAACSARPTPPPGLMQGQRRRGRVPRHARPTAHTLRMAARSATRSGLPAHARSSVQRGRQTCSRESPRSGSLGRA